MSEILEKLNKLVQQGRFKNAAAQTEKALAAGETAERILHEALLPAMKEVGDKFRANKVFVPEVMMSARAMTASIEVVKPLLAGGETQSVGKVVLGTVKGDMHDIGKNLVKIMMEGRGIKVIDLGTDVSPAQYIDAALSEDAPIVGCSALLTTTMPVMKEVVDEIEKRGLKDKIKVMIGGAPVTEEYAKSINADVYTKDAAEAAEAAVNMLNEINSKRNIIGS